jgi:hypothetical protein
MQPTTQAADLGPYTATISGKHYHLVPPGGLNAEHCPVDINDIAHHLCHVARFTGATSRVYTVAEHSILCADMAAAQGLSERWQLAALLHDAHEAYLNDMAQPIKIALDWICAAQMGEFKFNPWEQLENEHASHVYEQLGVASAFIGPQSSLIKQIDLCALAHEKATIGPRDPQPWPIIQGIPLQERWLNTINRRSSGWNKHTLRTHFLDRYHWLKGQIAEQAKESALRVADAPAPNEPVLHVQV